MPRPILVALTLALAGGCTNTPPSQPPQPHQLVEPAQQDPLTTFRSNLAAGRLYECCVIWPVVGADLSASVSEGALGLEYERLLAALVSRGQSQWARILQSPRVSLELKQDLITDIDELARLPD